MEQQLRAHCWKHQIVGKFGRVVDVEQLRNKCMHALFTLAREKQESAPCFDATAGRLPAPTVASAGENVYTSASAPLACIRQCILEEFKGTVWVGVDKDPHRRAGAS
eukprot:5959395-Pyramimonas_sp.AAC.1